MQLNTTKDHAIQCHVFYGNTYNRGVLNCWIHYLNIWAKISETENQNPLKSLVGFFFRDIESHWIGRVLPV